MFYVHFKLQRNKENNNNNNNNNNKYKTYIAHIQYKYFHMRITDDKNKINKSIKSYMYK